MWIDIILLITAVISIVWHFSEISRYERIIAERRRRIYRLENEVVRLNALLAKQDRGIDWQD
jgi:hypothetical protein